MEFSPFFKIEEKLKEIAEAALMEAKQVFKQIEETGRYNSTKVLAAFIKNGVSESHFLPTTGYGYNDRGREVLDRVFADALGAEDAMVRHFMLSGTHALTVALFGVLRPGDTMLSVAGKPYDTLDKVIGIKGSGKGSLKEFGIAYDEVPLKDGKMDYDAIKCKLTEKPRMVYLQRSRGYSTRPSITIAEIEALCRLVRDITPNSIVFVDNCYGEFVEKREPTEVGADLMAGSLIKNPGGSFAESGGYIAGRKDLVELCSYRLTSPGLGSEIGASLGQNKNIFRGLYFAPLVVANALKSSVFAAALFTKLGYECSPTAHEYRTDIVEQIIMKDAESLVLFCQGIQSGSPIDSFVTPEAWEMPGYDSKVVMAAGAFVSGSSIELSADGPLHPPYAAFMQGGVIFETAMVAILLAAQKLYDAGKLQL